MFQNHANASVSTRSTGQPEQWPRTAMIYVATMRLRITTSWRPRPTPWAALAVVMGCSGIPWPDEPGLPVDLRRSENVEAEDAFFAELKSRRQSTNLPALMPADRYQSELRALAGDLQAGKLSASSAREAARAWGRSAYGCEVDSYVLDCSTGTGMRIPDDVIRAPGAAIAYAAAHFRPRSLSGPQCAMLVVVPNGSETIDTTKP